MPKVQENVTENDPQESDWNYTLDEEEIRHISIKYILEMFNFLIASRYTTIPWYLSDLFIHFFIQLILFPFKTSKHDIYVNKYWGLGIECFAHFLPLKYLWQILITEIARDNR